MKRQKKKDGSIKSLVSKYEIMDANDSVEFLDERSFNMLINYYEKEDQKEKVLSVIAFAADSSARDLCLSES